MAGLEGTGVCAVCSQLRPVNYCSFCGEMICAECRRLKKLPKRAVAAGKALAGSLLEMLVGRPS